MDPDRVVIFDTTLRDGEQSPGISLNTTEKLEIAHQLARLGVDVIEAGFPIASPGDFEAVRAIAREVQGPVIAGLARAHATDVERDAGRLLAVAQGGVEDVDAVRVCLGCHGAYLLLQFLRMTLSLAALAPPSAIPPEGGGEGVARGCRAGKPFASEP